MKKKMDVICSTQDTETHFLPLPGGNVSAAHESVTPAQTAHLPQLPPCTRLNHAPAQEASSVMYSSDACTCCRY